MVDMVHVHSICTGWPCSAGAVILLLYHTRLLAIIAHIARIRKFTYTALKRSRANHYTVVRAAVVVGA